MFSSHRVSVWNDEKVLEMNSSNGCMTMQVNLMLLNHTCKTVKMVHFSVVYILQLSLEVILHGEKGSRARTKHQLPKL